MGEKAPKKKKKGTGCLTAILIIAAIAIIFGGGESDSESLETGDTTREITVGTSNSEIESNDSMLESGENINSLETTAQHPENTQKQENETPSVETAEKESVSKEKSPDEIRADYIALCKSIGHPDILASVSDYTNSLVIVKGTVIKSWKLWFGLGDTALHVFDGENIWYLTYGGEDVREINVNDTITCYGKCTGTMTYHPESGEDYPVPKVEIEYLDIVPAPETTKTETETETEKSETIPPITITPEQELADLISSCKTPDYKAIERNPADHEFELIKFTGKVIQVSEGVFGSVILRIDVNGDIWYVEYTRKDGESRILEDDIITCYGTCRGVKSYTTILGATVTIPAMEMEYFEFSEITPVTEPTSQYTQPDKYEGLTTGQKNALKKAESYLSFMAFSWQGLIDQLIYDQFSEEEALFAANNCGADWQKQALKKAESYLSFSSFSYSGLINQLEFDKFSSELAVYAADNCGADWNEQAVKKAKSYLDFMAYSRDGLISQLEYEGFTHEQAVYGVTQNGY